MFNDICTGTNHQEIALLHADGCHFIFLKLLSARRMNMEWKSYLLSVCVCVGSNGTEQPRLLIHFDFADDIVLYILYV